ncbi:MAG: alpha-glucosidase/alpha-galactosidase [Firmicutes bacterium]|nr:alpha-glucosidase/alpha-galactosidase [Bacillota bacterium]
MPKIAMIGAGSVVFAKRLIYDILSFPELAGSTISLMDIDAERLDLIARLATKLAEQEGFDVKIDATLDRREALKGADYVITMIQVGGLEAYELDIDIPMKYGIKQCVGDTLGPGGVFRGLRSIPVFLDICKDMEELCPDALLINYTNPMAMITWAINLATGIKTVGLCHSVQGTAAQLASYIGAPSEEVSYWVAGINHMAWFLRFEWNGRDAYPLLFEAMGRPEVYSKDKVRFEMMRHLGYFITESSGHLSEYVPYFRKRNELIDEFCTEGFGGETGFYLRHCRESWKPHYDRIRKQIAGEVPVDVERSHEYGAYIIHSIETGTPRRINGNVLNSGIITNLPQGCCVEVPCLVDDAGLHPCYIGDLPSQCAALNRTNINVQELAVRAALERDRDLAFMAVMFDPLTAALLSPREIRKMVDEMFEAEARYLPGW